MSRVLSKKTHLSGIGDDFILLKKQDITISMAKATKSSLSPEKAAYYDEREKQLQKEIRSAKNWMWWIAFICVVPGVILMFVFRDTSILTFTAVIGIIGVIAEGICGHISEKKLDALKRERVFGNQQQ